MRILALEASAKVAGCALIEDDTLLAEFSLQNGLTHSQTLMPLVESMFASLGMEISCVDAVAVSAGPGSFTGLRIGAATVKGLAYALGVPVIPVPTVDVLAAGLFEYGSGQDADTAQDTDELICPVMDARRGQVYTGIYRFRQGNLETLRPQCAIYMDELLPLLDAQAAAAVVFLGDAVPVYRERIEEHFNGSSAEGMRVVFAPAHLSRQRAASCAHLAMQKYREYGEAAFVNAEDFRPEYLRLSQAERERNAQLSALTVRRMEKKDIEAALQVEKASFSEPWTGEMFEGTLDLPYARYYVAELPDGTVAGICGLKIIAGTGEISNVGVLPAMRGRQIGRRMLERLLDDAAREEVFSFTLEVRASNTPAISLYEKLGFRTEGVRKGFYDRPKEDALIMWRRV